LDYHQTKPFIVSGFRYLNGTSYREQSWNMSFGNLKNKDEFFKIRKI